MMVESTTLAVLGKNSIVTVEIIYYMPDHPSLLQSFLWQFLDRAPVYPKVRRFLNFWEGNIEGDIHSVFYAGRSLVRSSEVRAVGGDGFIRLE